MRFTIEVVQEESDIPGSNIAPRTTVSVDGKVLGSVQRVEFEARADKAFPKVLVRLTDLSKMNVKVLGGEDRKLLEGNAASIAYARKLLSNFHWIDVP